MAINTSFFPNATKDLIKRVFDVFFSLSVLILGFPVFLIISFGVWVSSKGPIFHVQQRIGKKGKPFRFYKFRTMEKNAEHKLEELLQKNPSFQKEWNTYCKLKNDPRITSFGKFLRSLSLDELPQFWNVLIGDLSVVGPRPFFSHEIIQHAKEKAPKILSVKPGITGIWQVYGRSNLSIKQRIDLEESYIDRRSFFLDLKLIIKTIPSLFFSKGAY